MLSQSFIPFPDNILPKCEQAYLFLTNTNKTVYNLATYIIPSIFPLQVLQNLQNVKTVEHSFCDMHECLYVNILLSWLLWRF